jgi:hypothetical protein
MVLQNTRKENQKHCMIIFILSQFWYGWGLKKTETLLYRPRDLANQYRTMDGEFFVFRPQRSLDLPGWCCFFNTGQSSVEQKSNDRNGTMVKNILQYEAKLIGRYCFPVSVFTSAKWSLKWSTPMKEPFYLFEQSSTSISSISKSIPVSFYLLNGLFDWRTATDIASVFLDIVRKTISKWARNLKTCRQLLWRIASATLRCVMPLAAWNGA